MYSTNIKSVMYNQYHFHFQFVVVVELVILVGVDIGIGDSVQSSRPVVSW